jgi:hypothetical protein
MVGSIHGSAPGSMSKIPEPLEGHAYQSEPVDIDVLSEN